MNMPIGRRTEASMELRANARCVRERAGERGQSLFEFALVLPILMLVLVGMITFGIALNNFLELTSGATAGAQALSVSRGQTADPCSGGSPHFMRAAPNLAQTNLKFTITITPPTGSPTLTFSRRQRAGPLLPIPARRSRSDTGWYRHG